MMFSVLNIIVMNRMICNMSDGCLILLKIISVLRMIMLWMVLVFDISGVCNVLGIFEIIVNLMNLDSIRIVRFFNNLLYI